LTHYPVTTQYWRGVARMKGLRRPLRRACDWHLLKPLDASLEPLCGACQDYKSSLARLGYGLRFEWISGQPHKV
jgi:hypothetical protein